MKKKSLILLIASAAYLLISVGAVALAYFKEPIMEMYRIGYLGVSDSDGVLLQLLLMPAAAFLLTAAVWSNKSRFKVPVLLASIVLAIFRFICYIGVFNESEIGKILEGGFNTVMYAVFTASAAFLIITLFMSLFEGERFLNIYKRVTFIGGIVFAAFFALWFLITLIFCLTAGEGLENLWLLAVSCFVDGVFFILFAFIARLRADMALEDINYFRDLMKKSTPYKE
ncbi:MAG: hypothetical protein IJD95_00830 [Clostridia bacterium]|nr:hypothetical protein [Clostridia bacterium]